MEHTVSGDAESDDGSITYETDSSTKIQRVITMDGSVCEDVELEEEAILNKDFYKSQDPEDEEHEGWTGNEGATATHFYRNTALMVVPDNSMVHACKRWRWQCQVDQHQRPTRLLW